MRINVSFQEVRKLSPIRKNKYTFLACFQVVGIREFMFAEKVSLIQKTQQKQQLKGKGANAPQMLQRGSELFL